MEDGAGEEVEPELAGQRQLDVCGGGTARWVRGLPRRPRNAQDSEVPNTKESGAGSGLKRRWLGESQCGS